MGPIMLPELISPVMAPEYFIGTDSLPWAKPMMTEPVAVHTSGSFQPLRLSQATHLQPGHGSEERPSPPTERAAP